jgi:ATP-dependent helicase HrpA
MQHSLLHTLQQHVVANTPARPLQSDFRVETLPAHLFMNFKLVDEHGRQLDLQRNLASLKAEWGQEAQQQFAKGDVPSGARTLQTPQTAQALQKPQAAQAAGFGSELANSAQSLTQWTMGTLPELLELKRAGNTVFGYPALRDCTDHCRLEVYDEPHTAQAVHRDGVLRLLMLNLKEPLKYVQKNLPDFQTLAMLYLPLGTADELCEQWLRLALMRSALGNHGHLPMDEASFARCLADAKSRLNLIAQEIGRVLMGILSEYPRIQKKIQSEAKAFPQACNDLQWQLGWLLPKHFLLDKPWEQLTHYPRYLKAMLVRLERLRNQPQRDLQAMADLMLVHQPWQQATFKLKGQDDETLGQFAWQLQELRVSLFAQELKTPMPISLKRLQKAWGLMNARV